VAGLDVVVNDQTGTIDREALRRAVAHTAASEGKSAGEISVTLLDDDGIRQLNRRYLGRDRPTDVIAFSLGDPPMVLGDVYVGLDQARRQAADEGVPLEEELVRLAVHGTLHVLGHDHPEGAERTSSPMFDLQERLVRELLGD
jgi:rRNA maturation RNase YbeY